MKHCLGNHDVWGWDEKSATNSDDPGWGKAYSLDQLKLDSSYYTFEHAGWRFVVLDSITKDKQTVYRAELDEAQFEWLKRVLEETASSTPIVIISHIPILTIGDVGCRRQLAEQPIGHQMLVHQVRGELLNLYREHPNVKRCLSGHTHLTERTDISGLSFINRGGVCGQRWKGNDAHTEEG